MTRVPAVLAVAAVMCGAGVARAQRTEDLARVLDESVVTTASHTAETASTAPATSTTITADDLRRYGLHTLEEAINFLSLGVSTAGGRSPNGNSDLGARGVFLTNDVGNHFLVLIDGHVVNEPFVGLTRFDHKIGLPLEVVDHVEVVVGPGSVLYGSNAMLGVIHVITKKADELKGGRVVAETELPVWRRAAAVAGFRFDLAGSKAELTSAIEYWDEYGPSFELGPQNLGLDALTSRPTRTARGGPESGVWGGTASRSTFSRVPSGMLRLRAGSFEFALRGRMAMEGRPFNQGDFDDSESSFRERNASLDVKHRALLGPELKLTTRLYGDTFDLRDDNNVSRGEACPYTGVATCRYRGLIASRWAGLEVQASYDWTNDGTLTTLVGADGRIRKVESKVDTLEFGTRRYLADSDGVVSETDRIIGAYVQQVYVPSPAFGLNAGARLDKDPRFAAVASPRAAANIGLWRGATLRGIYAEAFRAPSFQETNLSNLTLARAQKLEPERVRSVEVSVEQRAGTGRVFFGAFRSWWKDIVELRYLTFEEAVQAGSEGRLALVVPFYSYSEYQNVSSIDSYGLNAGLEGSLLDGKLRYGVNVTEAYSRRNDAVFGRQPLPVAPRFYGNARVSYELGPAWPTLGLAAYTLSPRLADRALSTTFTPTPTAPALVDLRLTVSGNVTPVEGLSYRLSADYVFGDRGPYVIGPTLVPTADQPTAELNPMTSFRAAFGLQYDFFGD